MPKTFLFAIGNPKDPEYIKDPHGSGNAILVTTNQMTLEEHIVTVIKNNIGYTCIDSGIKQIFFITTDDSMEREILKSSVMKIIRDDSLKNGYKFPSDTKLYILEVTTGDPIDLSILYSFC